MMWRPEEEGGEGEENIGGGGMTPISDTPMLSQWMSPLCVSWPLGVTRSLGSIDRGLTASLTENRDSI